MHVSSPLSQRGRAREGALAGHNPALASTTHLSDTTRNATPRRWARPLPSLPPRREGTLVPETLHLRTSVIFVSCASNRLLRVAAREKSSPLSQRGRVREGALPPAINLTVSVTELLSIDGREPPQIGKRSADGHDCRSPTTPAGSPAGPRGPARTPPSHRGSARCPVRAYRMARWLRHGSRTSA